MQLHRVLIVDTERLILRRGPKQLPKCNSFSVALVQSGVACIAEENVQMRPRFPGRYTTL